MKNSAGYPHNFTETSWQLCAVSSKAPLLKIRPIADSLFPNEAEFKSDSVTMQGIPDLGSSKIRMKYELRSNLQQKFSVNLWCNSRRHECLTL
jgi:hypothetical protein